MCIILTLLNAGWNGRGMYFILNLATYAYDYFSLLAPTMVEGITSRRI